MGILWFAAIPTLCVVLVVSGVAKLKSPASTDAAFTSLQVPSAFSGALFRRGLPWAEIILGVLLLVTWGWVQLLVTLAALALFVAYLVLVAQAVKRNDGASCNCFGEWSQATVSGSTLLRNYVLVGVALLAVGGSLSTNAWNFSWVQQLGGSGWLYALGLLIPAAVASVILWDSLRSTTPQLSSSESAPVSQNPGTVGELSDDELLDYIRTPIPFHTLKNTDGGDVTLRELAASSAVFLVKLSPGCGSCVMVMNRWEEIAERIHPLKLQAVVGDPKTIPAELTGHDTSRIPMPLIDESGSLSKLFAQFGTPWGVVFGADQLLAAGPVAGSTAIFDLVDDLEAQLNEAAEEGFEEQETAAPHADDSDDAEQVAR